MLSNPTDVNNNKSRHERAVKRLLLIDHLSFRELEVLFTLENISHIRLFENKSSRHRTEVWLEAGYGCCGGEGKAE